LKRRSETRRLPITALSLTTSGQEATECSEGNSATHKNTVCSCWMNHRFSPPRLSPNPALTLQAGGYFERTIHKLSHNREPYSYSISYALILSLAGFGAGRAKLRVDSIPNARLSSSLSAGSQTGSSSWIRDASLRAGPVLSSSPAPGRNVPDLSCRRFTLTARSRA
jgi:hypothetical protein